MNIVRTLYKIMSGNHLANRQTDRLTNISKTICPFFFKGGWGGIKYLNFKYLPLLFYLLTISHEVPFAVFVYDVRTDDSQPVGVGPPLCLGQALAFLAVPITLLVHPGESNVIVITFA